MLLMMYDSFRKCKKKRMVFFILIYSYVNFKDMEMKCMLLFIILCIAPAQLCRAQSDNAFLYSELS